MDKRLLGRIRQVRKIREDRAAIAVLAATRGLHHLQDQGRQLEHALEEARANRHAHRAFTHEEAIPVQQLEHDLTHYRYLLGREEQTAAQRQQNNEAMKSALGDLDTARADYHQARLRREKLDHASAELLAGESDAEAAREEERSAEPHPRNRRTHTR